MIVVGVDGCKGGWVAARWDVDQGTIAFAVHDGFEAVLDRYPAVEVAAIAIDIPIGLMECGRVCDVEAKSALKCRKPSVFPAPDPRVACERDYHAANDRSRALCGRGISAQAFGIYPKVCEVNARMSSELQERVIEVHPEICFWAMNGFKEICASKHSGPGYLERWELLQRQMPMADSEWEKVKIGVKRAQSDDVLDAMAAAWTARRWAMEQETVGRFPAVPQIDERGLRAEIVY